MLTSHHQYCALRIELIFPLFAIIRKTFIESDKSRWSEYVISLNQKQQLHVTEESIIHSNIFYVWMKIQLLFVRCPLIYSFLQFLVKHSCETCSYVT